MASANRYLLCSRFRLVCYIYTNRLFQLRNSSFWSLRLPGAINADIGTPLESTTKDSLDNRFFLQYPLNATLDA